MTVEQIDGNRLIIALCDEDMKNLHLDYQSLCMKDDHSGKVLKQLLQLAEMETGIDIHNKKITVEALGFENGCVFLVTIAVKTQMSGRRYTVRTRPHIFVAEFQEIDDFLDCMKQLKNKNLYVPRSELYAYNDKYYLAFISKIAIRKKLRHLLMEFSPSATTNLLFYYRISEHGDLVIKQRASSSST